MRWVRSAASSPPTCSPAWRPSALRRLCPELAIAACQAAQALDQPNASGRVPAPLPALPAHRVHPSCPADLAAAGVSHGSAAALVTQVHQLGLPKLSALCYLLGLGQRMCPGMADSRVLWRQKPALMPCSPVPPPGTGRDHRHALHPRLRALGRAVSDNRAGKQGVGWGGVCTAGSLAWLSLAVAAGAMRCASAAAGIVFNP